ncbi:hypothetical protein NE865_09122 [Phthorimaea operculella]|nr:hypothetical protein NE865_09122 [Phthorimaea operculella]
MLACVCQPTETALLFKGGSPVNMGPLGTNKTRHMNPDIEKSAKMLSRNVRRLSEDKGSSPSLTSSPSFISSSGSLLNLRKIERKAKSTKILVNPVCSDSVSTSDDSNPSKKTNSRWNGKKKRLKSENGKNRKDAKCDEIDAIRRNEAREDKKSISCFKMKSSEDKSRSDEDRRSGKENCTNENVSNLIGVEKPDLINHSRKNSKEILVDESTMTDEAFLVTDQLSTRKTDRAIAVKENEKVKPVGIGMYEPFGQTIFKPLR